MTSPLAKQHRPPSHAVSCFAAMTFASASAVRSERLRGRIISYAYIPNMDFGQGLFKAKLVLTVWLIAVSLESTEKRFPRAHVDLRVQINIFYQDQVRRLKG